MIIKFAQKIIDFFIPKIKKEDFNIVIPTTEKTLNFNLNKTTLQIDIFDITKFPKGAIVNAANTQLMAGGGVCGAIFKASNWEALQKECDSKAPISIGQAVITESHGMGCDKIIHAVGPVWSDSEDRSGQLYDAYYNSLYIAKLNNIKEIAFPAISTGIYGYPLEDATKIAKEAISNFTKHYSGDIENITLTCFNDDILNTYKKIFSNNNYEFPVPSL